MNQNPEQLARNEIDTALVRSGWVIQNKKSINLAAVVGIAVCEYQTNVGPTDYILFVNKKPVGIIEAKREEEGVRLTMHEDESTGELTRFTDYLIPSHVHVLCLRLTSQK